MRDGLITWSWAITTTGKVWREDRDETFNLL
jgi:hypothetical protein